MDLKKLRKAFNTQKYDAANRGISFDFKSFDEWLNWWENTGHLPERGPYKGQYVMARYGDTGPYEIGNIQCITSSQNHLDRNIGNTWNKGRKHPTVVCPHCSKKGGRNVMNQWHFDSCRDKLA